MTITINQYNQSTSTTTPLTKSTTVDHIERDSEEYVTIYLDSVNQDTVTYIILSQDIIEQIKKI